jgi:hypothetical protein
MVKPLVFSVNTPVVNTAWVRFFTELVGPNDIDPLGLARSFRYRAYFNMGVIGRIFELLGMPADTLELLLGLQSSGSERPKFRPTARTWRHLARMTRFAFDKWRFARRFEPARDRLSRRCGELAGTDLDSIDERGLLAEPKYRHVVAFEAPHHDAARSVPYAVALEQLAELLKRAPAPDQIGALPANLEFREEVDNRGPDLGFVLAGMDRGLHGDCRHIRLRPGNQARRI